jgi:type III pantothenate kinase
MNLILDIGNTRTKAAIFASNKMISYHVFDGLLVCDAELLLRNFPQTDHCIVACTGSLEENTETYLNNTFPKLLKVSGNMALPFTNQYESKETQGPDRIAAIAGGQTLFPNTDLLVIDAGTAITFDFIDSVGNYSGGTISPGIQMRFRALHTFTQKLPLLSIKENFSLLGKNTDDAIISGVLNGICSEIEGYITSLSKPYPALKTIITGGDAEFLANKFKKPIFAEANLVLIGLNSILGYNANS